MTLKYAYGAAVVLYAVFCALAPTVCAEEATTAKRTGFPQDWSTHHIVFSRDGLAQHPDLIYREPRVLQQVMQHWQLPSFGSFESDIQLPGSVNRSGPNSGDQRDWSVLVGGKVVANAFPAKFSFYPNTAPSCTTDFVVFGLSNVTKANLVGFNNLYVDSAGNGFCTGTVPSVVFAYSTTTVTGGHVITSPVLSLDGTQVAFIESVPASAGPPAISNQAILHVVHTNGGGTIASPVTPTQVTLSVSSSATDTQSSPWIDYGNDIIYVGTDDGKVHKITGVFTGSPALDPTPWPVQVAAGHLSSPVLDENLSVLMIGSANGNLYQINTSTGVLNATPIGSGPGKAIVAPPIVDITNGTTFVVTSDLGYAAGLVQVRTSTMVPMSTAELGEGSSGGASITLYEPAVSHAYFTAPAGNLSGAIITLCGTGVSDTTPWQYAFGFSGITMNESPVFKQQLLTSTASGCGEWTEFYNPNINGGTDFFFFSLTENCTSSTGGLVSGCAAEETNLTPATTTPITPLKVNIEGGPSGIVVDNYANPATYFQASSIYFSAADQDYVYKLTQSGLQ